MVNHMLRLCLILSLLLAVNRLGAETPSPPPLPDWDRITVPAMKTSIYVGSVTLTTGVFERQGSTLSTTYEVKVRPWFFWGETGHFTLSLSAANLASLAKGEVVEFSGEAVNHRHKPRQVTGRAQPVDATTGKFKVRIKADGVELIFNSNYRLETH